MFWGCYFLMAVSLSASLTYQGYIGAHSRFFNSDSLDITYDSAVSQVARLQTRLDGDHYTGVFSSFSQVDTQDRSRGVVIIEEAYGSLFHGPWTFSGGIKKLNWAALEAFHPVDVINSRYWDSDFKQARMFGEPMVHVSYMKGTWVLNAYWMPVFKVPEYPSRSNRFRYSSVPIGAVSAYDSSGDVLSEQKHVFQYAFRLDKMGGFGDMSIHALGHVDRSQPVFVFDPSTATLTSHYLYVHQVGGSVQWLFGDNMFKSEWSFRSFTDADHAQLGPISRADHSQWAFGLERPLYFDNGHEWTSLLEFQSYQGVSQKERAALGLFQQDVLLGGRYMFNDVSSTELLMTVIVDVERKNEMILSSTLTRRIFDAWMYDIGFQVVQGKSHSDGLGLQSLAKSDHIFMNMVYYF
ncbi:hypothetical protein DID78_05220 [Candidatus Marinamargulisbacteria bacterium SCGC AG-343-D04]|nr:hypothetical protein DID78_05220 [Candidatus Marinamargulisbacteria bacterium SCGC AG-343-D04]